MPNKNPLTLALIVIIIILAFMLYCNTNQSPVSTFEGIGPIAVQPSSSVLNPDTQFSDTEPTLQGENKYQNILLQSLVGGINTTGIVSSDNVNSGLELGDPSDPANVEKYQMSYQDIVNNEIGHDNIASQKSYAKYVKSDSSMRYLDTDLSANYSNYYGLSLSRRAKANDIAATDSSQIQGIDASAYDSNQTSLREFYVPPTITPTKNPIIPTTNTQSVAANFRNK